MEDGITNVGSRIEDNLPLIVKAPQIENTPVTASHGVTYVEDDLFQEAFDTQDDLDDQPPNPEDATLPSLLPTLNLAIANDTDDFEEAIGDADVVNNIDNADEPLGRGTDGTVLAATQRIIHPSIQSDAILENFHEVSAILIEEANVNEILENGDADTLGETGVNGSHGLNHVAAQVFMDPIAAEVDLQSPAKETEDAGLASVLALNNFNVGHETYAFEEAIGHGDSAIITGKAPNAITEEMTETPASIDVVEIPYKIDEGGTGLEFEERRDTETVDEATVKSDVMDEGGKSSHKETLDPFLELRDDIGKQQNETLARVDTQVRDNDNDNSNDADILVHSDKIDDKVEEVRDTLCKQQNETFFRVDTQVKDNYNEETNDADLLVRSGNIDDKVEEVRDNLGKQQNETLVRADTHVKDTDNEEPNDADLARSGNIDDKVEEVRDTLGNFDPVSQDNSNGDIRVISAIGSTSSEEGLVKTGNGSSAHLEKIRNVQEGIVDLTADEQSALQLPNSVEKVNEVNSSNAVAAESVKEVEEDLKKIQTSQSNGAHETRPVASAGSSLRTTNSLPSRPAGLGQAAPLLEPVPRAVQQPRVNGTASHTQTQQMETPANGEAYENDETREKLQMIRVKFLRLAHRLGQTPHNVVVAQVLYRLGLAEQLRGRNGSRVGAFSFDRASAMAEQLEAAGQEPLDFSCTIMVLGKSGVGKSATINSIFDEVKFSTNAFQMGTKKVQDVVGTVQGIKVRVIDTPGLLPSLSDQRQNEKILHSVKRFINKTPPDIVLYLDRLDMQSRDLGDMPLLRTITEIFGPSIWFNAIVVLTHAASAPPDGPNGTASSYDLFVTQRTHVIQQAIRQAAGDMRLMNPVSLVENHSACRTNRAGQRVLPNGQVWKPHLLLLSFASKILAEANALLQLQDNPPGKPFAARPRAPPLPFLLSSLLQSRQQVTLPEEQYGDEDDLDDDLDETPDSDEEPEYDQLPPFKRLTKAQMAKLTREQKKEYLYELECREKLFMKKQLKEEKKRRKIMKKMAAAAKTLPSDYSENIEEESGAAASVPVPMPDLTLPASFDSDNPTHRYRYLDSSNQWLVRPVLETLGWDHDVGYEGVNAERLFAVKEKIPISFSGQVTMDKKDTNVQMELTSSIKHGVGKATSMGFDMQTVGKDLAYTLRSETRFSNYRKNKASAGLSVTILGDALSAGLKFEDKLIANNQFKLVATGGAMTGRGDVAYGGTLEAQLRDKDYPLGRFLSTLGLSVMDWHGDLAIGGNIQSQVPIGRAANLIARANLNNRGSGQVSVRINSSEQLQIALVALVPLLRKLFTFTQQTQYGQH